MIHRHLYRARLVLLGAGFAAIALVAAEFPFALLFHQRSELAVASGQLATVSQRNAGLRGDIRALQSNATIAEIAHEDYGLVDPGQLSYVILPPAGSAAVNSLTSDAIAPRDLVAPSAEVFARPRARAAGPGLWSRFLGRLEFWR